MTFHIESREARRCQLISVKTVESIRRALAWKLVDTEEGEVYLKALRSYALAYSWLSLISIDTSRLLCGSGLINDKRKVTLSQKKRRKTRLMMRKVF